MNERMSSASHVTWVGFVANLGLTALKLVAGIIGRSGAMVADAVHSLSDVATDIIVLVSFRYASKPVDKDHDYGHGKYETVATAFIGGALLLVALGIFWEGAQKIWASIQGEPMEGPGIIALAAAVVSVVVKEVLYHYTVRVGKRVSSQAVIANAWHHRSDVFSSLGVLLGIGGAIVLGERWHVLDPIAAVIVSIFIAKVAIEILSGSIKELTDESLDEQTETEIIELASSVEGVAHPHSLRTRRIGSDIAVDLHICVDDDMHVSDAHSLATKIEDRIRARFGESSFISIHVEPHREHYLKGREDGK